MRMFRALVLCLSFFFVLSLSQDASGWWKTKYQKKRSRQKTFREIRKDVRGTVQSNAKKRYSYVRSHDYNGDGKVDRKDRLIWLNNRKGNYDEVYVSEENQDIVEVMDLDGDGNVEGWEMKQVYSSYDLNGNGTLEAAEIDAVQ